MSLHNYGKDERDFRLEQYNARKEAVEIVEDLCIKQEPSVQPPMGKWIPVSEMLPSDCNEDWVLAQIIEPDTGYLWIPCVAEYRKGLDDWYTDSCGLEWVSKHEGSFKVIAWMPLPEQYKHTADKRGKE